MKKKEKGGKEGERREDGRRWEEMRELSVEHSLLKRADGSAKVRQGETCVICCVYGPSEVKQKEELIEKAKIEVLVEKNSGKKTSKEMEIELFLEKLLERSVLTSFYPRTALRVVLQIVKDEGSLLSVCVNATSLALLDAAVAMKATLVSLSFSFFPSRPPQFGDKEEGVALVGKEEEEEEEVMLVDSSFREECLSSSNVCLVFDCKLEGVVCCKTSGTLSEALFFDCIQQATSLAKQILSFFRISLEKKFAKASLSL